MYSETAPSSDIVTRKDLRSVAYAKMNDFSILRVVMIDASSDILSYVT